MRFTGVDLLTFRFFLGRDPLPFLQSTATRVKWGLRVACLGVSLCECTGRFLAAAFWGF